MCFPVGCAGTVSGLKPTPQGHHCFHSKKMPTDRFMNQQPLPKSFPFSDPDINIYTTQKPECSAHNLLPRYMKSGLPYDIVQAHPTQPPFPDLDDGKIDRIPPVFEGKNSMVSGRFPRKSHPLTACGRLVP
jgi:hypothetical protein